MTSESSDSEFDNQYDASLNFSHRMLDDEAVSYHLRNSIHEQEIYKHKYSVNKEESDSMASRVNSLSVKDVRLPNKDSESTFNSEGVSCNHESTNASSDMLPLGCAATEVQLKRENHNETQKFDNITQNLVLSYNHLLNIPLEILLFTNLKSLDLSNNNLSYISDFTTNMTLLQSLFIKQNVLSDDSLPKDLSSLVNLREINVSGNELTRIPEQFLQLRNLKYLYAGNNKITQILPGIKELTNLQVLHVGGNLLEEVPDELGELPQLTGLVLCDNQIKRLPRAISQLKRLRSLLLHRNRLCCLPVEIVKLRGLTELSLRENPLVNKFINSCAMEIMLNPPSLMELAARSICSYNIAYGPEDLPHSILHYLESGHRCVNPKCKGMYFTSCVEHIKFVDFCGKYRVPLMHYLCSSRCSSQTPAYYKSTTSDSDSEEDNPARRMKKVLLG